MANIPWQTSGYCRSSSVLLWSGQARTRRVSTVRLMTHQTTPFYSILTAAVLAPPSGRGNVSLYGGTSRLPEIVWLSESNCNRPLTRHGFFSADFFAISPWADGARDCFAAVSDCVFTFVLRLTSPPQGVAVQPVT